MSELQLALIVLAALALLALYVGGKWQELRHVRRLRERLQGGVGDALLQPHAQPPAQTHPRSHPYADPMRTPDDGARQAAARSGSERVDPMMHGDDVVLSGHGSIPGGIAQALRADPGERLADETLADGSGSAERHPGLITSEPLVAPTTLLQPDWAEDPLLDCSLEIRCARAVDGVSVIDAATALGHSSWKLPVHFVVWDGRHQQWVLPDRFGYYTDALASIQLANRRACIDETEIARFVQVVQELAQTLGADFDAPDPARLVAQAQELDRLCARFDMRIGLNVDANGVAWTGPQLRNAAHECGFIATGTQSWVRRDGDQPEGLDLYSLQVDPARMTRLTLELDIAVAPVAAQAFGSMVDSARALAAALGGRVVDDNDEPIETRSVEAIEHQLTQVFEEMRAAGIEPGSTRARRLYA